MSDELKEHNERLLAEILADVSDPAVRAKFRKRLKVREDRSVANEKIFNDAYAKAMSLGIGDPTAYAQLAVDLAFKEYIHAIKVADIKKAPLRSAIKTANYDAETNEARSRTASPAQRRNPQTDRRYLEIIGSAEREARLWSAGSVGSEIEKKIGRYRLPHWEKTTVSMKCAALSLETARRGGRTINLRIGHTASKKAMASSRGPVSFMQNQVRETLKRRFEADAPEFWFLMEKDNDDLFHLHGAYVDQPHIPYADVDKALRDAGSWTGTSGSGLSQMSAHLEHPLYWASYVVKQMNITSLMTDRKLLASTAEIRDAARGSWDGWRSRLPVSASM